MTIFNRPNDQDMEFVQRKTVQHFKGLLIAAAAVFAMILLVVFLLRVTRIEAGHVGIEINLAGSQRGASEIPIRTGWVFYSPSSTQIIQFPTYVQTVKWTRNPTKAIRSTKRWALTRKRAWRSWWTSRSPMPSTAARCQTST